MFESLVDDRLQAVKQKLEGTGTDHDRYAMDCLHAIERGETTWYAHSFDNPERVYTLYFRRLPVATVVADSVADAKAYMGQAEGGVALTNEPVGLATAVDLVEQQLPATD